MSFESHLTTLELRLPVKLLPNDRQWAGIDRGGSLTKVIYITPEAVENPQDPEYRLFQCIFFSNKVFVEAIKWLKEHAYLPESLGPLHVTGFGCVAYREFIEETFGVKLLFIEEFLSQIRGTFALLKHLPLEEVCHPQPVIRHLTDDDKPVFFRMVTENLRQKLTAANAPENDGKLLPALLVFVGSATGITSIDEEANAKIVSACLVGGKYFVGLGKALSGTSNYNEICEMASRGFRGNVDMQPKDEMELSDLEIPSTSEISHYGKMDLEKPVFFFGKLADKNKPLSEYDPCDLLSSHVSSMGAIIAQSALSAANSEGIRNIILGGNLMNSEVIRKEIEHWIKLFGTGLVQTHYLKFGHTGAIGSLLTSAEENAEHMI